MATLSAQHRRFLIVDECIVAAIVCFFVNIGLGWIFFHRLSSVPFYGMSSIVNDTLGMAFMLPLFTAIGATLLVGRAVSLGKLTPLSAGEIRRSRWLHIRGWQRGALLGVGCMLIVAVPVLIALGSIGKTQLSLSHFIWFKGLLASVIGVLVTPVIGWWALGEASLDAHAQRAA